MFPIPWNFPFRKKNGDVTTLDAVISGGGSSYVLPTASADTKGGVKVGSGLSMDGETLNNTNPTPYILPTASADTKGGVKVGSGLSINENGVLSANGGGGGGGETIVSTTMGLSDFPYTATNAGYLVMTLNGPITTEQQGAKALKIKLTPKDSQIVYSLLSDTSQGDYIMNQRSLSLTIPMNVGDKVEIQGSNISYFACRFIQH